MPDDGQHPILRHNPKRQPYAYVVVGRGPPRDPTDHGEVWLRNPVRMRRFLTDLDVDWETSYYGPGGGVVDRKFVSRRIAEANLCSGLFRDCGLYLTRIQDDEDKSSSMLAERAFLLLVTDGVLRNPPPSRFRGPLYTRKLPLPSRDEWARQDPKEVRREEVWEVCRRALVDWVMVRLLLLDGNPRQEGAWR